jgi:hypothetical protein
MNGNKNERERERNLEILEVRPIGGCEVFLVTLRKERD